MKRDDRLFCLSIVFVILCMGISLWRTYEIQTTIFTGAPVIDRKLIDKQIQSGNLSLHEAEFYKVIKK